MLPQHKNLAMGRRLRWDGVVSTGRMVDIRLSKSRQAYDIPRAPGVKPVGTRGQVRLSEQDSRAYQLHRRKRRFLGWAAIRFSTPSGSRRSGARQAVQGDPGRPRPEAAWGTAMCAGAPRPYLGRRHTPCFLQRPRLSGTLKFETQAFSASAGTSFAPSSTPQRCAAASCWVQRRAGARDALDALRPLATGESRYHTPEGPIHWDLLAARSCEACHGGDASWASLLRQAIMPVHQHPMIQLGARTSAGPIRRASIDANSFSKL